MRKRYEIKNKLLHTAKQVNSVSLKEDDTDSQSISIVTC